MLESRPTAVNLRWAIERILKLVEGTPEQARAEVRHAIQHAAPGGGLVIATGNNTFFGRTASLVATAGGGASHSARATTQIGDFLIFTSVLLCVILVGFQLYRDIVLQSEWQWAQLADIARTVLVLLIASIPVAMPTVITVTNSLGAQALARKKAIVSRLEAIEEIIRREDIVTLPERAASIRLATEAESASIPAPFMSL